MADKGVMWQLLLQYVLPHSVKHATSAQQF